MREFVFTLSDSLLRASWQGGLALGLVWAVCRAAPRMSSRLRCWLWRLAYLKLLVAFLWLPPILLPALPAASPSEASAPGIASEGLEHAARANGTDLAVAGDASSARFPLRAGLLAAWLIGVGVCLFRTGREWRAARCLKRLCVPEEDADLIADCRELCRRLALRHPPRLLAIEGAGSPLLLGGAGPTIILPSALRASCTPAELRLMLAHELAHLRRQDLWWCWLPALAHGLFFFHPMVWLANREWRMAQEVACDALALEVTHAPVGDYGSALLKVAVQSRPILHAGLAAVSANEFPQTLQRRLVAMKTVRITKRLSRAQRLGMGAALALVGVVGLLPWRVVAQSPAQNEKQSAEARNVFWAQDPLQMKRRQEIAAQLGLTDSQIAQIKSVLNDIEMQGRAVKQDDSLDGPAKEARMREVMQGAEQRVKAILTPDQMRKLAELGGVRALLFPGAAQERWTIEDVDRDLAEATQQLAQVGLTDAQKARLNQIFTAVHNQAAAILANRDLSDAQRAEAVKRLRSTAESQAMSVLTPAQRQKMHDVQLGQWLAKVNVGITQRGRELAQVGLTDAQKAHLEQVFAAARSQMATLFANRQLPDEQRADAVKKLYHDLEEQITATLTPAQREKLSSLGESAAEDKAKAEKQAQEEKERQQ
jgi:beta-lactamase regulating signal transducer with metallopeptidase domain